MASPKAAAEGRTEGQAPGVQMVCPSCNSLYPREVTVCRKDGSGLLEIPDTPLLTGTALDDRYEIGGVIGAGGMGVVYRAFQRAMERAVAIKVLHPHYAHDPRAVKRFFREAQAASRLIHPNVVTVYDFGRSKDGHLYMVMELLEGWTLGDLIHHRAPLSAETAGSLAIQVCHALEAAHRRRIVHRDLKPDNVQLVSTDSGVFAKVLDFGIARVMRSPDADLGVHLSTVDIAGTPAYMSPEQIMGKDPDPRSDLYSLGVILFEMLTGERPFDDENSVTLCMKQLNEAPPALSEHVEEGTVPAALEAVVVALLSKDVAARPKDAAEVARRLAAATGVSAGALPEAAAVEVPLGVAAPVSLPTRPDAGAIMALPTASSRDESGTGLALSKLGQVIDQVRSAAPEDGGGVRPAPIAAAATAKILASRAEDLAQGPLADWLAARRSEGWEVVARDATATVGVPAQEGIEGGNAARFLVDRLHGLRRKALESNLDVRMGVVDGNDAEVAGRLAAAASSGDIAASAPLSRALGYRGRPITSVHLPSGEHLAANALEESGEHDPFSPEEFSGRDRELRRLGQLADEARREGPVRALVLGGRGEGKTALLRTFLRGRRHLYVRASPAAHAWPGHTAGRIARACLGLAPDAADAAVRARLESLQLALRERLALLLLDASPEEGATAAALGQALVEVLDWRAEDGGFCLAIDDAHRMDAASRELLAAALRAAERRPWVVCLAAPPGSFDAEDPLAAGAASVELRPLGLRAASEIGQRLGLAGLRQGRVLAVAQGNPLALELLGRIPVGQDLPPAADVHRALLPPHLRGLPARQAERAWLDAVTGRDEAPGDLPTRAARLYLELGTPENVRLWLAERLRKAGDEGRRLASAYEASGRAAGDRADRTEKLGLWRLAATEHEEAAVAHPDSAAPRLLAAARLRARSGDVAGAVGRFEEAMTRSGKRPDVAALVRLGAALLDAGETERAEVVLLRARTVGGDPGGLGAGSGAAATGELAALLARCAIRRSEGPEAMAWLGRARETEKLLRPVDARAARGLEALCQEVRAEVALAEGDSASTRTNLRQARDAFRDLGRPADAIRCLVDLGRVELDDEDPTRAEDTFRAATGLAATAGLLGELRRSRIGLGLALVLRGETEQGTALLRRVLREAAGDCGDGRALADAAVGLAQAMLEIDLSEDALRYADRALAAPCPAPTRARALLVRGRAWLARGELRHAARDLQDAAQTARRAGHGLLHARAESLLCDLEMTSGTPFPRAPEPRPRSPRTQPGV